nr:class I SAM-dependent methyltransferase [Bacteroidota bacterium]
MKKQYYHATLPEYESYAEKHTTGEPDYLYQLYRETHLKTIYPRMLSGHLQGTFLKMISRILQPERILEIGTFTGYATICLALGLPENGIIHTIDSNPESVEIGRKYFKMAGVEDKIHVHIGNALNIIPDLTETYDLAFIDADKENYLNYYHMVIEKLNKNGVILADNAFWDGKVFQEDTNDKEAIGIKKFNQFVQNDPRVENILLPLRDGLMMIRKI